MKTSYLSPSLWSLRPLVNVLLGAVIIWLVPAGARAGSPPPATYDIFLVDHDTGQSVRYSAPGSYSFASATADCVIDPAASAHTHGNSGGDDDDDAAITIHNHFIVTGPPTGDFIPISGGFVLRATATAGRDPNYPSYGQAIFSIGGYTDYQKSVYAQLPGGNPTDSYSGTASILVSPSDRSGFVDLYSTIHTRFGGTADAYADPYVYVDPAWADAHPGYSLTFSQGVSNGAPGAIILTDALSSKTNSLGTTFNKHLALGGNTVGVEDRRPAVSGQHQLMLTFADPVTVGGAAVTSGVGTVSSFSVNGRVVTLNLTAVADAQILTIGLTNVNNGNVTANISFSMGFLIGDVNGDGTVNSGDAIGTRNHSGQTADVTNFQFDVNGDGFINAGDSIVVRSKSGNTIFP